LNKQNIEKPFGSDHWKIPLYKIYTDDEDLNLITKILKRGSHWAIGPEIQEFENQIKNYVGADYCACLNSGTSALHATLLAYNIKNGDEIIVPSFSFIATANSVVFVDAIPQFADIDEVTFGLDPNSVSEKITQKTKAVIPMDYGGPPCRIFEIIKVAKKRNLLVIEDGAEALGAKIKEKKVGTNADATIFSFCGNKVLTTGEGGAVTTNSKDIFEKIKLIRSHGRVDKGPFFESESNSEYVSLGYNWRMSSFTAALGISQLNKLDKIIKMRQKNAEYLSSKLSKFSKINPLTPPQDYEHIYQLYTVRLSDNDTRNRFHDFLTSKRIFSKVYFDPIHLTTFYRQKYGTKEGMLTNTEKIASEILTLPLYPNMTNEEKEYMIDSISEFFENN